MEWLIIVVIVIICIIKIVSFKMKSGSKELDNFSKRIYDLTKENPLIMLYDYAYEKNYVGLFHDEENTKFNIMVISNTLTIDGELYEFNVDEIRKVELYEDNTCAMSIGRAVVGGALFGTAGAIVGGSSGKNKIDNLSLVLYTKNVKQPQITVPIIVSRTSKDSVDYTDGIEFARNVLGVLEIAIDEKK